MSSSLASNNSTLISTMIQEISTVTVARLHPVLLHRTSSSKAVEAMLKIALKSTLTPSGLTFSHKV
jgi:hypothetical protein